MYYVWQRSDSRLSSVLAEVAAVDPRPYGYRSWRSFALEVIGPDSECMAGRQSLVIMQGIQGTTMSESMWMSHGDLKFTVFS